MNENMPVTGNINKISPVKPDTRENKSPTRGDGTFDKILADRIQKSPDGIQVKSNAALPEIDTPFNVKAITLELDQSRFANELTDTLNLFDRYASWLGDPDKTLKESFHLLEQVLNRTKSLSQKINDHSDSSDDLKKLITQVMTLAQVEQIKFNRGDYLL